MSKLELIVVDPGHFHAALAQKEMYPNLSPLVRVYAPVGPDLVDYLTRRWARQSGVAGQTEPAPRPTGCLRAGAVLSPLFGPTSKLSASSSSASVVQLLHAAISCGTLTKAGQQRVDGVEATKLTSSSGSLISETIWVNPITYLPVRVVIRSAAGSSAAQQTADITWLKPSAANLAVLTVSIPAGFRQVPFGPAVAPLSPRPQP